MDNKKLRIIRRIDSFIMRLDELVPIIVVIGASIVVIAMIVAQGTS